MNATPTTTQHTVTRFECQCSRCGHQWVSLTESLPRRCANPKCRSPYWEKAPIVYVAKWNGAYKIGCSGNIKQRYNSKRGRADIILEIPAIECNKFTLEQKIHWLFSGKRVSGAEMFDLNANDLAKLKAISESTSPLAAVNSFLKSEGI